MEQDGFAAELSDANKRWGAVARITEDILGFKFRKQNIRSALKKIWRVDLD